MSVYSGHDIFKLMDTHGLPLDVINMMLREQGDIFNAAEFIEAAKKSGWPDKRILNTMISASPLQGQELAELILKIQKMLLAQSEEQTVL